MNAFYHLSFQKQSSKTSKTSLLSAESSLVVSVRFSKINLESFGPSDSGSGILICQRFQDAMGRLKMTLPARLEQWGTQFRIFPTIFYSNAFRLRYLFQNVWSWRSSWSFFRSYCSMSNHSSFKCVHSNVLLLETTHIYLSYAHLLGTTHICLRLRTIALSTIVETRSWKNWQPSWNNKSIHLMKM